MDPSREKNAIEVKLARCRELAKEFPHEPTAQMIRDLEAELRRPLRELKKSNRQPLELGIGTAVGSTMPKQIAITLWSLVAACLFAFGAAALIIAH
jgi:hypothetical protein